MEEHSAAIFGTLVPLLLSLIGIELAVAAWWIKRHVERNERDHDTFFRRTNEHEVRLTRVETEVTHLQHDTGERGERNR